MGLGGDLERGPDEAGCVFGFGIVEDVVDQTLLDDLAVLHHHHAVAEGTDDFEVVRDEEVGEAFLRLELAQQLDDLRLHRQVERRGRLVQEDELGLQCDGTGDGDALALATGKFVREAIEDRVGETRIAQGLSNPFDATRYHSLVIKKETWNNPDFEVSAWTAEGEIMGVRHKTWPLHGVQFHPESFLTVEGPKILRNFLELAPTGAKSGAA